MKKIILIGLLIISVLIVACSPGEDLPDEEIFEENNGIALVGQAYGDGDLNWYLVDSCSKADDVESDPFVKGTLVSAKGSRTSSSFIDKCWKGKLLEYYCDGGKAIARDLITCESGCEDGACVKEVECIDTDGGQNLNIKGTTTGLSPLETGAIIINEDSCSSPTQVVEFYCEENMVDVMDQDPNSPPLSSSGTDCPEGTGCEDGACVEACEDWGSTLNCDYGLNAIVNIGMTSCGNETLGVVESCGDANCVQTPFDVSCVGVVGGASSSGGGGFVNESESSNSSAGGGNSSE